MTRSAHPAALLLELALRACEQGDSAIAAQALRGFLALDAPSETARAPEAVRAVSLTELARVLGYSVRHLRSLLRKGIIPADAVLSSGRGTRVLVDRAIDGLRQHDLVRPPDVEAEGAELARRRAALRLVRGGEATTERPRRPER